MLWQPHVWNAVVDLISFAHRGPGRRNPDPLKRHTWDELRRLVKTRALDQPCSLAAIALSDETEGVAAAKEARAELLRLSRPREHRRLRSWKPERTLLAYECERQEGASAKEAHHRIAEANRTAKTKPDTPSAVRAAVRDARKRRR